MENINILLGNDKVFRVESPNDFDRAFIVTHKKTGLWVECHQSLDITQAKGKLLKHIDWLSKQKDCQ